jgi:DNA (cytosine-5)-methyltransferase 1
MKKLKVFDLFTGVAGFSLGIIRALGKENVEIVGFGDIEKDPIAINKYNFPGVKNYKDGEKLPDFDLLVGGSPCQDLSIAGKREGLFGKRSGLFFYFIQLLKEKQPINFIFENVKGLLSSNKGRDFKIVQKEFKKAGYEIEFQLLNSKDFGVPQKRQRIYVVGHLKGLSKCKIFPLQSNFKSTIVKNILETQIVSSKYYLSNVYLETLKRHRARQEAKGHGFGYIIIKNNEIANTIVIGGMGKERNLIIDKRLKDYTPITAIKGVVNREGIRRMTPIEWERLQAFPDNWTKFGINEKGNKYEVSDCKRYKAMGNALIVNIVTEIVKKLYNSSIKLIPKEIQLELFN